MKRPSTNVDAEHKPLMDSDDDDSHEGAGPSGSPSTKKPRVTKKPAIKRPAASEKKKKVQPESDDASQDFAVCFGSWFGLRAV